MRSIRPLHGSVSYSGSRRSRVFGVVYSLLFRMRLSTILFFGKKPYGFKYRGKHRAAKPIKPLQLATLRNDYERTEQNMLVLRHPYLTVEQSFGHMSHVNKIDKLMDTIYTEKAKKFAKHVTLAERLVHLKVKEAWD